MVSAPCLAQEVEPEGIFSLHGTEWWWVPLGGGGGNFYSFCFYKGDVYERVFNNYAGIDNCYLLEDSFYLNLLTVSFFKVASAWYIAYGIMQPLLGIGVTFFHNTEDIPPCMLLIKISCNWIPQDCE